MATRALAIKAETQKDDRGRPVDKLVTYYDPARAGQKGTVTVPLAATDADVTVAITAHIALRHRLKISHVHDETCCAMESVKTLTVTVPG